MSEQLFQIAVKGLIRNKENKILMVNVPAWSDNEAHWDLPGGRMESGESILDTLDRELREEIGTSFVNIPSQLSSFLTNITIPVSGVRVPLFYVVFAVEINLNHTIELDPNSNEDAYDWFSPKEAVKLMEYKFPAEFCDLINKL